MRIWALVWQVKDQFQEAVLRTVGNQSQKKQYIITQLPHLAKKIDFTMLVLVL